MNFLTESIFRQIQSLQEQGRETEAANVAQQAYAATLNERKDEIIRNLGSIEKAWAAIKKEAGYAMDAFLDIGRSKTLETRLEKAQAALASYQGTLPGKRTVEQVAAVAEFGGEEGLKREIAGLQDLIENQRKSAQMERERAAAVKASGELAQGALKYETDLEKQRREVLSATEKYETALKNQNLTQEQRNRLEADYIKLVSGVTAVKEKSGRSSTAAADNKDLREQQRIYAELADVSSTYYNDLAAAQEQRAKGKIGEAEYVKYVEELIQKQPFAVAAAKAHAEAIKDEAKAAAASAKTLSAWYEVREKESQGLQNQINARREDVMLMGMSAEAVAEYTQAKYEQLAAEKEAYAAALESASFYAGEYAEAYKAAAEAARQQAKQLRELGALEVEKVSKGAAKKAADEWQRTADDINRALTDSLLRGFESGKDAIIRARYAGLDTSDRSAMLDARATAWLEHWTMDDIARAYGVGRDDLEKLFTDLGIPAFAAGINRVPNDMVARIHKDEAIIPAAYNPFNPGAQRFGGSDSALVEELRALRKEVAELRLISAVTASNTAQLPVMADQFDSVTEGGNAMRGDAANVLEL